MPGYWSKLQQPQAPSGHKCQLGSTKQIRIRYTSLPQPRYATAYSIGFASNSHATPRPVADFDRGMHLQPGGGFAPDARVFLPAKTFEGNRVRTSDHRQ